MEILLKFFGLIQMIYLKIVAIYFLWNILGKRFIFKFIFLLFFKKENFVRKNFADRTIFVR